MDLLGGRVKNFSFFLVLAIAATGCKTETLIPNLNRAPIALSATEVLAEDSAHAIALRASDEDGDALSYRITAAPRHGSLSGVAPAIVYTPHANFSGVDSFKFAASDAMIESAEASIEIQVTPVNDAPTSNNAQAVVYESDTAVVSPVVADIDGDALSLQILTAPLHGVATVIGTQLSYVPANDFFGNDSFTYRTQDAAGAVSAPSTVAITVLPAEVHVIGVYEAGSGHSGGNHPTFDARVQINVGHPVILAFASYEPVRWNLEIAEGTKVLKVYKGGYYAQTLTGLPSNTPVVDIGYAYAYDLASLQALSQNIRTRSGHLVNSFQGAYQGNDFVIGTVPNLPIPVNAEAHYVSAYQPAAASGRVEVRVDRANPVVLILKSYESIDWNITALNGTRIAKVIVSSYYASKISGAPADAFVSAYIDSANFNTTVAPLVTPATTVSSQYQYSASLFNIQ